MTSTTVTTSTTTPDAHTSVRRLRVAMAVLVLTDLVGGLLAVASSVNTWGEAWGPEALLAAPVPMIVAQVLLVLVATRWQNRWAVVAAVLLAVACLVSVVSGFFDGGLRNDELSTGLFAFQLALLAVTTVVGLLAAGRAATVVRLRRRTPRRP
jgi:hypothetical protein